MNKHRQTTCQQPR